MSAWRPKEPVAIDGPLELPVELYAPQSIFDEPAPDPNLYVESELFVAGALSTMPPFASHHPAYALPFARAALEALGRWEPSDANHESENA